MKVLSFWKISPTFPIGSAGGLLRDKKVNMFWCPHNAMNISQAAACIAVALRWYSRVYVLKRTGLEDYLVTGSWASCLPLDVWCLCRNDWSLRCCGFEVSSLTVSNVVVIFYYLVYNYSHLTSPWLRRTITDNRSQIAHYISEGMFRYPTLTTAKLLA